MLGVNSKRKPVSEPFASLMREALNRTLTGQFNAEEVAQLQRIRAAKNRHKIVWK